MAISKKHSRKIKVEDEDYRWKFDQKFFKEKGTIAIQLEEKVSCKLIITLPDWTQYEAYPHNWKENKPSVITPSFIEKSIKQAQNLGWEPKSKGSFHVNYDPTEDNLKL